jgi:hypothetical protein
MRELTNSEVKELIDQIGPSLGCDYTYDPVFPEGRRDVCAVCRAVENGSTYGFDVIYLVWRAPDGSLKYKKIEDSSVTRDYIYIKSVVVHQDGRVTVHLKSGGCYSGIPWEKFLTLHL